MKRIEYRNPEGRIRVAATNTDGTGFFTRAEHEGAYQQEKGGLAKPYTTRAQFVRELKRRGMVLPDESNIVREWGWGDDSERLDYDLGFKWNPKRTGPLSREEAMEIADMLKTARYDLSQPEALDPADARSSCHSLGEIVDRLCLAYSFQWEDLS